MRKVTKKQVVNILELTKEIHRTPIEITSLDGIKISLFRSLALACSSFHLAIFLCFLYQLDLPGTFVGKQARERIPACTKGDFELTAPRIRDLPILSFILVSSFYFSFPTPFLSLPSPFSAPSHPANPVLSQSGD
jgi:hypothetical protein